MDGGNRHPICSRPTALGRQRTEYLPAICPPRTVGSSAIANPTGLAPLTNLAPSSRPRRSSKMTKKKKGRCHRERERDFDGPQPVHRGLSALPFFPQTWSSLCRSAIDLFISHLPSPHCLGCSDTMTSGETTVSDPRWAVGEWVGVAKGTRETLAGDREGGSAVV